VLYVDHGSDFTSQHLDLVAAALRIQVAYSAVGRPQGRARSSACSAPSTPSCCPNCPGISPVASGRPRHVCPWRSWIGPSAFIAGTYHLRPHGETGWAPLDAWRGGGFLPRLPESLEELDLLLVMHVQSRMVQRDGIRFQGLRYTSPTLAGYVREPVTIRYDPRDLSEIRVFHRDRFLCRAVSEEHAGAAVTLKDIETARRAHRLALRAGINERVERMADYLPIHADPPRAGRAERPTRPARTRLRIYEEDGT